MILKDDDILTCDYLIFECRSSTIHYWPYMCDSIILKLMPNFELNIIRGFTKFWLLMVPTQ